MLTRWPILLFGVLLWIGGMNAFFTTTAAAQIIIDPPPEPHPLPSQAIDQVQVELYQVDATIDNALAQVQLTQILRNDSPRPIEGTYIFPLPENSTIGDFQMTVDGEVLEGEILRKEEARRIYEEIVRQQRDPALLEYIGRDLFQVSVFPILAGESRTLELTYSQVLTAQGGLYQFRYPLQTRQYTSAPIESLVLNIDLVNQPGLRTIYSTNYAIAVARHSDQRATVGYEATNIQPKGDFALYFGTDQSAIGINVLSYQPAYEDGYFVMLAAPSVEVPDEEIVQRDVVMVIDVSGSMQGEKMEQAINAAHYVVDQLNPGDRFNLINFSTGVRLWQPQLQIVDEKSPFSAHHWIDTLQATGGTDINRALMEALAQLSSTTSTMDEEQVETPRPAYVLFLTDGLPTQGERNIERIIANVLNNQPATQSLRLFSFGVGYDVNTTLLDTLSGELGGRSSYVKPDERIDEEISHFYNSIRTPVLSSVTVAFGDDLLVDDLYPFPLPDLFAGEQLVLAGRYRSIARTGSPQATVTLHGTVNGESISYRYPNQRFAETGGESDIARLWASRKIGMLLQEIRRNGPDEELVDAIVELGLQYGIVTPYTSAFVPEPNLQAALRQDRDDDEQLLMPTSADTGEAPATAEVATNAASTLSDAQNRAQASTYIRQSVGASAVAVSEQIEELETADVAQSQSVTKFVAGRTFVPQTVDDVGQNYRLTRWVDTLYNNDMEVETVLFGSDCYFALLARPQWAEWLSIAPDLIVTVDKHHALLITTIESQAPKQGSCVALQQLSVESPPPETQP